MRADPRRGNTKHRVKITFDCTFRGKLNEELASLCDEIATTNVGIQIRDLIRKHIMNRYSGSLAPEQIAFKVNPKPTSKQPNLQRPDAQSNQGAAEAVANTVQRREDIARARHEEDKRRYGRTSPVLVPSEWRQGARALRTPTK